MAKVPRRASSAPFSRVISDTFLLFLRGRREQGEAVDGQACQRDRGGAAVVARSKLLESRIGLEAPGHPETVAR